MFFDARAAKQLQPGKHLLVEGCEGLRLVATASRRTWTYRYKGPGDRMKQVAFGQWPAVPVQAAAAEWQRLRDQRAAGVDPGQQRRQARQALKGERDDPARYKVSTLVEDFLTGHLEVQRKGAGAVAARRALERFLDEEPNLADQAAAKVSRSQAFDAIDTRKATPTSAAKLRSMLGSAWDYALDAGRLDGNVPNWWRLVMKGRLKSKGKTIGGKHAGQTRRVLRPTEIAELLAWLPNMHELGRDTTQMYLWTCVRGVEILAMRPEHITHEADGLWWTVPRELTKNARFEAAVDLRVPLLGRARVIVERRLEAVGKSGWLFENRGGLHYLQKDFSTYVYSLQPYSEKIVRRGGGGLICPATGWTPHNLRRTGRTLLASIGCTNEIAEAIIGHLPEDIVGTYNAYTYDAERRVWLTKLSERLEVIAGEGANPVGDNSATEI